MIDLLVELFGTGFVYQFFARRKADRRRTLYDEGQAVSFVGFVGGTYQPADVAEAGRSTSLRAAKSGFWVETKWPLTPQRREIPGPRPAAQIEFPSSESRPKLWYEIPAARYASSSETIEIYCQRLDLELLRRILCDRAVDTGAADQ